MKEIQSLCLSLYTAGSLAISVVSTDGALESGRITTKTRLELCGNSRAKRVQDSNEHGRTNTQVIQCKRDHGDICGELPRKDVPASPAGDRILCWPCLKQASSVAEDRRRQRYAGGC